MGATTEVTGPPTGPPNGPGPEVSVIIPVCNGGSGFARCLEALRATAASAPPWELIVVDDGSTDGSPDRARAVGARIVTTGQPRSGPAVARNIAAAAARGRILLFIDADVVVTPETVGQVADTFRREPSLGALFGSYDRRPADPGFLSQYRNLLHHYVHQTSRAEATTFWAGCGAVRRELFARLGGFEENYGRPSIEDIEFGYRLTRAGYPVRLCHDIQVTHLKRWTPGLLLRTDLRDRGIPWVQLILRNRVFTADLNLQTRNRLSVVCTYLLGIALLGVVAEPLLLSVVLLLAAALIVLNAGLYAFFARERGLAFAAAAIPWHWLYYTCNGLSTILGVVAHLRSLSAPAVAGRGAERDAAPAGTVAALSPCERRALPSRIHGTPISATAVAEHGLVVATGTAESGGRTGEALL